MKLAEQSTATVYTIGIYDADDHDRNPKVLKELARLTGGEFYAPNDTRELQEIWQRVAGGIRHQYTIGYFSTNPSHNGSFRDVKDGQKIRTASIWKPAPVPGMSTEMMLSSVYAIS